jgi:hypothetical protein
MAGVADDVEVGVDARRIVPQQKGKRGSPERTWCIVATSAVRQVATEQRSKLVACAIA